MSPLDRFFKALIGLPGVAGELARFALPEALSRELDFHSRERADDSWVDPELKEHFGDRLFRLRRADDQ